MKKRLAFIIILLGISNPISATKSLEGKVALITGASKGIGKSTALLLAQEGAKVVLVARTGKDLKTVTDQIKAKGGDAIYSVTDITKLSDVEKSVTNTLKKYGRLDIVIHNAGIYPAKPFEQITEADWHKVIATNLDSTFYVLKTVIPFMKKQKYGRISLTSSISGPRTGLPEFAHYTASKAGMNGLMRTVAVEMAHHNITINAVEPGTVMTEGVVEAGQAYINKQTKSVPMGRLATPEEIANVHLFLVSDKSRYITGQSIIVDGGQILPENKDSFTLKK